MGKNQGEKSAFDEEEKCALQQKIMKLILNVEDFKMLERLYYVIITYIGKK